MASMSLTPFFSISVMSSSAENSPCQSPNMMTWPSWMPATASSRVTIFDFKSLATFPYGCPA